MKARGWRDGRNMNKLKFVRLLLVVVATVAAPPPAAQAGEGYKYEGSSGFGASFYLIGGQYQLYINARQSAAYALSSTQHSCVFAGNLQRLWPTHDATQFGGPVPISNVQYKINTTLALPAGLYRVDVAPLTDCNWTFVVISTSQNSAGVAPVQMLRRTKGGLAFSPTASVNDQVQFYAQVRTDHDARVPVSGTLQIVHDDKLVQTFPLKLGTDDVSKADVLFADIQWEQSDTEYLGKNTAKFIVKIGESDFTSTGEFTLAR